MSVDVSVETDEPVAPVAPVDSDGSPTAPGAPVVPSSRSPLSRRRIMLLGIGAAAVLVSGGGLAGAALVKSPAQVAADSKAPPAQWLTASVDRRVLASSVVVRGTVASASTYQVAVTGTPTQGAAAQVVTAVHVKPGDAVTAGSPLFDVSGRPLVALKGAVPAYRDLKPGVSGTDVAELQDALKELGFAGDGDEHGFFGTATKAAVSAFYKHLGYDTPTTGGPQDRGDTQALQAAQNAVDTAQRAVDDLRRQMAAIAARPPGSSAPPSSSSTSASSPDKPAAAQPSGPSGQEPLPLQLEYLQKALDQARQAQADLIAGTGPMMPLSEFVFLPELPAKVADVSATVGQSVGTSGGVLATLSSGTLGVTAQLTPDQGRLVKPGMRADLTAEVLGRSATAKIGSVGAVTTAPLNKTAAADVTGTAAQAGTGRAPAAQADVTPYVPLRIDAVDPLAADWEGQDVRVTITAAATPTAVLVVPVAAVSSGADGKTTVSWLGADGLPVRVPVRTGLSADGFVEVAPIDAGALKQGDAVVVGR